VPAEKRISHIFLFLRISVVVFLRWFGSFDEARLSLVLLFRSFNLFETSSFFVERMLDGYFFSSSKIDDSRIVLSPGSFDPGAWA